jgi:putative membrane protein
MRNTGIIIGIMLIFVVLVLLISGAGMMGFGGYGMGPGMMGGYGGMMRGYSNQFGFGFNPLGAILLLVFWALIIAGIVLLVVWFVRKAGASAFTPSTDASPLDVAKACYARGEISKAQYEELRRDLA